MLRLRGDTSLAASLAREVIEAGAGIIVLLNKWDALDEEQREATERSIPERFGFVSWAPALRISALTGARLGRLADALEAVFEARETRIPTGRLNKEFREWIAAHPPPVRRGRRPKLHYVVQAGTAPPTFVLFVSGGDLGDDYVRFLENQIRRHHDFTGNPLHFVTRNRSER